MSLLLLVMSLLALFHLFYQSVIVKTNFELYENDVALRKHELDIYEIKHQNSLNTSELEYFKDVKEFIDISKEVAKEYTLLRFILGIASRDQTEIKEDFKEYRLKILSSEELHDIEVKTARDLFRNLVFNGSIFLFLLSPLIILVMLYRIVAGKKISIEQQIERMSSRHC